MRTRFAVLLAVVALVLLMLPAASQAWVSWTGSSVTLKSASTWTRSKSVGIDYYGTVSYTSRDVDSLGEFYLVATGNITFPPDEQSYDITQGNGVTNYTMWCSGDANLPLTAGDGVKQFAVRFDLNMPDIVLHSPQFSGSVTLDTHGPKTVAPYPLACKKGGYVTVSYQVNDSLSPKANVTLRVSNSAGKTLKTAKIGQQDTGKLLTYLWKCPLGKGRYRYSILAIDLAGNKASKAGANSLTVR